MPRPREFDNNQVLDNVMQVFWSRGYDGTTMRDLVTATGLQPGSLYGAYKSKRKLFSLALDHYERRMDSHIEEMNSPEMGPLESIRHFFDELVGDCGKDDRLRGCLFINTLLQIPPSDIEITRQVTIISDKLEKAFVGRLGQAQSEGSLHPGRNIEVIARLLLTGVFGLRVFNKTKPGYPMLRQVADELLKCLED